MATMSKRIPATFLAALVTLTLTALPARAETPLHRPVEVNFDGISIERALATLGERVGVQFEYDADLMKGQYSVTYQTENQEAGRVAMQILYPRGLELGEMRGDRVRIVKRDTYDEFKPNREEVYEFVRKPALTREGDDVTITFETAGWCDVTVAIEDDRGTIIRHLACGVLGPNAPEPFVWNSKAQTIIWDGKNDQGEYVDDKDAVTVRVSLGLKPRFERTHYWHPGKPSSQSPPRPHSGQRLLAAPAPEGVYVYSSGQGSDHVRLFDRDGDFVRTVYPFPADKIEEIPDMIMHRMPDGPEVPIKPNWFQSTLLKSGSSCETPYYRDGQYRGGPNRTEMHGNAGNAFTVSDGRIALVGHRLSRMATDGGTGGLSLHGPETIVRPDDPLWTPPRRHRPDQPAEYYLPPRRAALSPDGKWLYLARHNVTHAGHHGRVLWHHMVRRMPYKEDGPLENFAGGVDEGEESGQFNMPADVACDAQGRVYVADHLNDRIQIFDDDGDHLQNVAVKRPALIDVHPETGEFYVFSWALPLAGRTTMRASRPSIPRDDGGREFFRLTKFSPVEEARELESWDLREAAGLNLTRSSNVEIEPAIDHWADPPRMWIAASAPVGARRSHGRGMLVFTLEDGEWTVTRDLLDEAVRSVVRVKTPTWNRQRLYVNPRDGMLYMGYAKVIRNAIRIDPNTGRIREVQLPISTEDMAFDLEGHAYLRTRDQIVRYDPTSWREVPFDYGEERDRTGYGSGSGTRTGRVISGAIFPGNKGWHHGGIHVNAKGDIVVSALYSVGLDSRRDEAHVHEGEPYRPQMYPGRRYDPGGRFGGMLVHVIDRHGRMIRDDVLPGMTATVNGTAIDIHGNVYLLYASARVLDGNIHFNEMTGTVMKFASGQRGQARLISPGGAPVSLEQRPDRPYDLSRPSAWVENADWIYGGVGWGGYNSPVAGGCACPNARFVLDYFARSFTPEHDRYNIGVLDSSGNLILRVGQYGNVDDGLPLVKEGGPPNPRSIGGDEMALFDARYVATHTDHRLFIADIGNARVVSVKLGYHTDELVPLKDIPDTGGPAN